MSRIAQLKAIAVPVSLIVLLIFSCDRSITVASANSLHITTPAADGDDVKGRYIFKVDANDLPSVSTIEFAIGSLSLGLARSSPFQVVWNTGYGKDGNYAIQATARDASGQIISTAERVINIINSGGRSYVSSPDI